MTIQEIRAKADCDIKKAREDYKDGVINFLKENNLKGKVIRVRDSKIGYLHMLSDYATRLGYSVYFYPLKKDGTESKKYEMVWEDEIVKAFKPYED